MRISEAACPFCASALPEDLGARAVPAATRRLERLAAFTFAAGVAVAGCSAFDGGSTVALYGMPAEDSGPRDPSPDAGDAGDASADAADAAEDDGGTMALYGMPRPDDAGD